MNGIASPRLVAQERDEGHQRDDANDDDAGVGPAPERTFDEHVDNAEQECHAQALPDGVDVAHRGRPGLGNEDGRQHDREQHRSAG